MRITPGTTENQRQGMALAAEATKRINEIRADGRLSPEGKSGHIAAVYQQAKERLSTLAKQERDARAKRRLELERAAFGLKGDADPATAISYRDAQDRVASLNSRADALNLLGRAERGGDEILARAVGQRAVEQGWSDVLQAFTEGRPGVVKALEELQELNVDPTVWALSTGMSYDLPVPAELRGMSDNTIRQAAEGVTGQSAAQPYYAAVTG